MKRESKKKNQKYDGNNLGINTGINPATNHDDDYDAVDTSKSPLMVGGGTATFASWTGYAQGINGLIYDINSPTRAPVAGDFTFRDIGKQGTNTAAGPIITPSGFGTYTVSTSPPVTRCVVTFTSAGGTTPTAQVRSTWLQVTVGTGFGLAAAETHWWGNAYGDTGTGNTAPNILVSPVDMSNVRANPLSPPNVALVTNPYDINKDRLVFPVDQTLIRNNPASPPNTVKMIVR